MAQIQRQAINVTKLPSGDRFSVRIGNTTGQLVNAAFVPRRASVYLFDIISTSSGNVTINTGSTARSSDTRADFSEVFERKGLIELRLDSFVARFTLNNLDPSEPYNLDPIEANFITGFWANTLRSRDGTAGSITLVLDINEEIEIPNISLQLDLTSFTLQQQPVTHLPFTPLELRLDHTPLRLRSNPTTKLPFTPFELDLDLVNLGLHLQHQTFLNIGALELLVNQSPPIIYEPPPPPPPSSIIRPNPQDLFKAAQTFPFNLDQFSSLKPPFSGALRSKLNDYAAAINQLFQSTRDNIVEIDPRIIFSSPLDEITDNLTINNTNWVDTTSIVDTEIEFNVGGFSLSTADSRQKVGIPKSTRLTLNVTYNVQKISGDAVSLIIRPFIIRNDVKIDLPIEGYFTFVEDLSLIHI